MTGRLRTLRDELAGAAEVRALSTMRHEPGCIFCRTGCTREGVARNAGFTNDGRVDLVVFSLIRSDLAEPHG